MPKLANLEELVKNTDLIRLREMQPLDAGQDNTCAYHCSHNVA